VGGGEGRASSGRARGCGGGGGRLQGWVQSLCAAPSRASSAGDPDGPSASSPGAGAGG